MKFLTSRGIMAISIFSLAYFIISFIILDNSKSYVDFTSKELRGLEYHRELMLLLTGSRKNSEVDNFFKNNLSDWLDIEEWHSISSNSDKEETTHRTKNLMLDIGDKSNLILDPELPSYYLMNIIVKILPNMLENTSYINIRREHKTNLNRSIRIISQNPALKEKISKAFTHTKYDKNSLESDYMITHDLLREHLSNRINHQYNIFIYTLMFIVMVYVFILVLGAFVVRNYVAQSEVKSAREKQRLLTELEEKNNELEQFAYVASHDLKEPVRMVANFATLLKRKYSDKLDLKGQYYTQTISESAKRMENMIIDLLSYARVDDEQEIEAQPCDCNLILNSVLENLNTLIEENNAEIIADNLPQISANPVRFSRLLQNLISNAIRYGRKESQAKININAKTKGDYWQFSIKDNGIGINKEYLKRIFEPFKRLHNQSHSNGTGIGLAICKKIVERNGGEIWVESEPNKGSTFFFTWPI